MRRTKNLSTLPSLGERFGVRSLDQVRSDLGEVLRDGLRKRRFQAGPSSVGLLRPDLSLAAYAGLVPDDGLAPIFNLFDRVGGGRHYSQRVTRATCRDFRGGRLTYDEHDGTDFVCPVGTHLRAAAPGTVVMARDKWLRGGLTVAVDHGGGLVTQYTHCSKGLVPVGETVARGEPVALSGAAGFDLVQFFPWVPPHIHFMVWRDGRPMDPYLAPGEAPGGGHWVGGAPVPSGPLPGDPDDPRTSPVDADEAHRLVEACADPRLKAELVSYSGDLAGLAAVLDDALHHESWAWPFGEGPTHRPPAETSMMVSLPLPADDYAGARFADSPLTRP